MFSGDSDFRRLVEAVQRAGVRVSVVSSIRTSPPMVADELRRQADQFLELADIAPEFTRRQTEPRVARRSRCARPPPNRSPIRTTRRERAARPQTPIECARTRAGADCPLCPRLSDYRQANRAANPDWFNAPVPSFGGLDARLLIVGLAPGVRGANRTGRPFTGDFAGMLLYRTLLHFGLAHGTLRRRCRRRAAPCVDCRVTNAVRCVPPGNLPTPLEIGTCNRFLTAEIAAMTRLRGVLALGGTAHAAVLRAYGIRPAHVAFRHGEIHDLPEGRLLADSYHVSRLNTNTGRLTEAMFHAVVEVAAGQDRSVIVIRDRAD